MIDRVTLAISGKQQDLNDSWKIMAGKSRYGFICSRSQSSQEEDEVRAQKSGVLHCLLYHLLNLFLFTVMKINLTVDITVIIL